jgi:hypothetical protein
MNHKLIESILKKRHVRSRGIKKIFLEKSITTVFVLTTRLHPVKNGKDMRVRLEQELKTYYPQLKGWYLTWVEYRYKRIGERSDTNII